jgi:hypothetical protein
VDRRALIWTEGVRQKKHGTCPCPIPLRFKNTLAIGPHPGSRALGRLGLLEFPMTTWILEINQEFRERNMVLLRELRASLLPLPISP